MANPRAIENHSQNNDQNGMSKIPLAVVMVPFPAQGHVNPLLHLSRLVSAYDIPVHFVGTTAHNRRAQIRVQGWDPLAVANIQFHNFPTPPSSNTFPDSDSSGHLQLLKSTINLREPVYNLVDKLSATAGKIVVIYDSHLPYVVQDIRSIPNAESYCFQSISAFTLYSFYQIGKDQQLLPSEAQIVKEVPSFEGCFLPEQVELSNNLNKAPKFNSGDIYNTCRVIEGLYIDLLAKEKCTGTDKNWAIGPFNPVSLPEKRDSEIRHKSLDWLDKQEPNSVIFVSFGSTSSLSDEQIKEIAFGLERSEAKFIWPRNAFLVTKVLKIGVELKNWDRRDELISSIRVEKAVRTLMNSGEGDEIRKRVTELGNAVKKSLVEGGVTKKEMDSFIAHISK
ncbi:hypothetical protein BUALT_Bualt12G0019100 [Buddleja alternifolia]|uniref:Glycosyltransferase N-terminal domain-containing protein n=1 Tax=Buddleja alternifolia TaxID=168488 RepID=A0AAV6WPG4_9LAMI|nr:hypothetical protein BUALT_Bualt12G0019100 [Buddleja alternifolia]